MPSLFVIFQRRLRHLRNIAARNIVNRNGHELLDTYFTLHLCSTEKIYKGKGICGLATHRLLYFYFFL